MPKKTKRHEKDLDTVTDSVEEDKNLETRIATRPDLVPKNTKGTNCTSPEHQTECAEDKEE
jgi:hypothetical protein